VSQLPRLCLADGVLTLERARQLHRLTHRLTERQRPAETLTTSRHATQQRRPCRVITSHASRRRREYIVVTAVYVSMCVCLSAK